MRQLEEAQRCRELRDQAIHSRSKTLHTYYEEALSDYREQYNEEPWLILAKEGKRER